MSARIEETLAALRRSPVVVCLRTADEEAARRAAYAVLDGGLRVLEVTLTTPGALGLIAELAADERALVGAGTALDVAALEAVADAGGAYALSPVCEPAVIAAAEAREVLYVPGAATPTEIHRAHGAGARVVKVFPIGPLGGPGFIRAVRGPLPAVPLMPTNGVGLDDLDAYFEAGVLAVGMGREILDPAAVRRGDWSGVTARARAVAARLEALG